MSPAVSVGMNTTAVSKKAEWERSCVSSHLHPQRMACYGRNPAPEVPSISIAHSYNEVPWQHSLIKQSSKLVLRTSQSVALQSAPRERSERDQQRYSVSDRRRNKGLITMRVGVRSGNHLQQTRYTGSCPYKPKPWATGSGGKNLTQKHIKYRFTI